MKKIYQVVLLSFIFNSNAQFNPNAPWMRQTNQTNQKVKKQTFEEIVNDFNEYWKGKDINKKGSGYKPFKRWENFWKDHLDENGMVMKPSDFEKAIAQKELSKKNTLVQKALPVSNWIPVGPIANASTQPSFKTRARGRVNIITVDPNNANTMYFGTPAGGVWKSTNAGGSWIPLSDELPQIGVSGIAVDPTNSNTVYIATGDKDASDTDFAGVYKSTDGGLTWQKIGGTTLDAVTLAGDLVIHPTNNQILWLATNTGLFRTTNGGTSWTNVQVGTFHQGAIRLKPGNSSTIYAVTDNSFYKSTDSGATFTQTNITSTSTCSRMLIDVTPANPNYVYLLSAKSDNSFNAIHTSTDSGASFSKTTPTTPTNVFEGTQAWYDLAFAASPTTLNELYVGCLNVWKTTDAGATNANWSKLNSWNTYNKAFTHADIHHLQFFNNTLYCGSDGGIYTSSDRGINFTDITAEAQITQFYKIAVSRHSAGNMTGGAQDNGGYALSNNTWKGYHGGDGMDCAVNPLNKNEYFGFTQYGGSLNTTKDGGYESSFITSAPAAETGTNDQGGNWVTPMAINTQGELFAGYSKLYRLNNSAWVQQSTSSLGTGNVENVVIDPRNDNNMFVSNGITLYKSTDKGITFTNVYSANTTITSIDVSANDSNTIYITTSGSNGGVFKSVNGGTTFSSIGTGIPAIAKLVVKNQGRNANNPIYVGTSIGVYYRDDSMSQFQPFDTNLPNVPIYDLEVHLEDKLLIAGTRGRGVWQTTIPVDPNPNDVKIVALNTNAPSVSCNTTINPTVTVKNNGANNINTVNTTYNYNGANLNHVWNGTIAPGANQQINLPQITVNNEGAYKLEVTSTVANDAVSFNNVDSANFNVNNSGNIGTMNQFSTVNDELLSHDEGSTTSQWVRGINTNGALATPGNTVYSVGRTANYLDGKKAYLYSNCYNLNNITNPRIRFNMGFALEENFDILYVEYTTNMGQTWNVLGTMGPNWYNSNRTPETTGNDCENCRGAQWTGGSGAPNTGTGGVPALTPYSYPLNSLIGNSNVIFRFVFHSDPGANDLGVTVDDFLIDGTLSNNEAILQNIEVSPNPSKDIFTITLGDKLIETIKVYDVSGKIVFETSKANTNRYDLNLSEVASGIYFAKIESGDQSIVKRLLKN